MSQIQFDTPSPARTAQRHRAEGGLAGALAAADEFRRHLAEAQSRAAAPASAPPLAPSAPSPSPSEAAGNAASRGAAEGRADDGPAPSAEQPVDRHEDQDNTGDADRPAASSSTAPADAVTPTTTGAEPAEQPIEVTEEPGARTDAESAEETADQARAAARAAREIPAGNPPDTVERTPAKETESQATSESPALSARDEPPRDIHRQAVATTRGKQDADGKSVNELVADDPSSSPEDSAGSASGQSAADGAQEAGATQARDHSGASLPAAPQAGLSSGAARTASANASTGRPSRKTGERAEPAQGKPSDGSRREGEPTVAPATTPVTALGWSGDALDGRAGADGASSRADAGAPPSPLPSSPAASDGPTGAGRGAAADGGSAARAARGAADDSGGGVDRARFVQRVSRAFHSLGDRGGVVRLRLSPPELGSLRLEVSVRDGAMTARLEVETQSARHMLLDSLPALRERLAQQDIRIERFSVDVGPRDGGGLPNSPGQHGSAQDRAQAAPIGAPLRSGAARALEQAAPEPAAPDHGHQLNVIV